VSGAAPGISCRDVRRAFDGVPAIAGVDLDAPAGALTAILGPSGCGKTTLLRTIAGFERPDRGRIDIAGRAVVDDAAFVPPERRAVGMVFQDYALFPHLDVAGNVAYGLGRRPDRSRVAEVLETVGLAELAGRRPHELSGGQQQRVALARALAPRPAVILLDEPFSSVDGRLRAELRRELRTLLEGTGVTALLVTHDQDEALSLADHVVLLRAGTVVQAGPPEELYRRPASRWAAELLGPIDVLPGLAADDAVETPLGALPNPDRHRGAVDVLLRPEQVALDRDERPDAHPATVVRREFYGHDQLVELELADGVRVHHRGPGHEQWQPGDRAWARVAGEARTLRRGGSAT